MAFNELVSFGSDRLRVQLNVELIVDIFKETFGTEIWIRNSSVISSTSTFFYLRLLTLNGAAACDLVHPLPLVEVSMKTLFTTPILDSWI